MHWPTSSLVLLWIFTISSNIPDTKLNSLMKYASHMSIWKCCNMSCLRTLIKFYPTFQYSWNYTGMMESTVNMNFLSLCQCMFLLENEKSCPYNRPWRLMGLWDVEDPIFYWQSTQKCQAYAPIALYPRRVLVLIYVSGLANPTGTVRLEGLDKLKTKFDEQSASANCTATYWRIRMKIRSVICSLLVTTNTRRLQ
jgi:hypothetical protein